MGLCLYFLSILKSEADVVGAVNRGVIHHAAPAFEGEFRQDLRHLLECCKEVIHAGAGGLLFFNHGSDRFQSGLGPLKTLDQALVAFLVFALVKGNVGILPDGLLNHIGNHLRFFKELGLFGFQVAGVKQEDLHFSTVGNDLVLGGQQLVCRRKEVALDFFICQVWCSIMFVAVKLVIALPDGLAVLAVGVPDL